MASLIPMAGGCSESGPVADKASNSSGQFTFLDGTRARKCISRCGPTALSFARAQLGIDPEIAEASPESSDLQSMFSALQNRVKSVGGLIEVVPFDRFIEGLGSEAEFPAVLVHESGHLHILLGMLQFDDKKCYQVVHGSEGPFAFSPAQLANGGFREAWSFHGASEEAAVPIKVGAGCVTIDKLWHNCGEVLPFTGKAEAVFTLKNIGETSVVNGTEILVSRYDELT